MSVPRSKPTTKLSRHTADAIYYGDSDLVQDLLGKATFTEVFMKQTFGRSFSVPELRMVEAILVALMEHGMTPSAIAARMVYSSSPENLQAGVAAGLLAVGSRFVGTMEEAGVLLGEIVSEKKTIVAIAEELRTTRNLLPGFGHHLHKPDDPRAKRLIALSRELGIAGKYVDTLLQLSVQLDIARKKHLTINTTGAIAAILGDMNVAPSLMRGFAILARAAGLISHLSEEQREPSGRFIWDLVDSSMERKPQN
jgi:citrate synthase